MQALTTPSHASFEQTVLEPIVDGSLRDPNSGHGVTGLRGDTDAPPTPFDGTMLSSTVLLSKPRSPMWMRPWLVVAAFVVLALGVLIFLVSQGSRRATVSSEDAKTVPETAAAPPPAIAPFSADEAQQHQAAWAKYLGVPVEHTNSIGMKFVLIPPGEFMMGSTPEEFEATLKVVDPTFTNYRDYREMVKTEVPQHRVI